MNPHDLQKISENNMDIETEELGLIIRLLDALEPFSKQVLPKKDITKPDSAEIDLTPTLGHLRKAKEVYEEVSEYLDE